MSFLSRIGFKAAKTANDFETRIVEVETALTTARNKVADLEAKREHAIFDGVGDPDKITAELTAARADIETLTIALAGAQKRKGEAEQREASAKVETEIGELRGKLPDERKLLSQYARQADALVKTLEALRDAKVLRDEINAIANREGRGDLAVENPYTKIATETGRQVREPTAQDAVIITDFWPRAHPDGSPFLKA